MAPKEKSLRYLIVGYGNIGNKRHSVLGKKCVATVDPNTKTGADFRDAREVPLEKYDVAVLTVPQEPKFKLTEYFLSKGKHVLVEKPLIITRAQGKRLATLAKGNKGIWYTSYNHQFEPNIVKIQKLMDSGFIGKLYHARFVYSFGNIQERIGTWRETQFGVLEEISPHVIDFAFNLFGYKGNDFIIDASHQFESKIFDHWLFSTKDKKVFFETSSVTWKNVFSIDIFGNKGSIHMNGLNKWDGSSLSVRTRILPSGAPKERNSQSKGLDNSWKVDFNYFEKLVTENKTSLKKDLETSKALANIASGAQNIKESAASRHYKNITKER